MGKRLDTQFAVGAGKQSMPKPSSHNNLMPTKTKASNVQMSMGNLAQRLKMDLPGDQKSGRFGMKGNPPGKQVSDSNADGRGYQNRQAIMFGIKGGIGCANVKGNVKGKGSDGRDLNCK